MDVKNKGYFERAAAFNCPAAIKVHIPGQMRHGGKELPVLEYQEDGDIVIRMQAMGAKEVRVASARLDTWEFDIALKNCGDGVFEGILPASLGLHGNVILFFTVDGVRAFNPSLPAQYYANMLSNFIEAPDPETPFTLMYDVPHGAVTREVFWSETIGEWIRCMVYTPPTYHEGGEYPVLYLQHGAGENETAWMINGRAPFIMDNVLAEGKAVPCIVVTNDGMLRRPGETHMNDFAGIEGIITEDCRRHIESRYRVKKDKWNRAIAGLSLGSMQACYIGMRHPELFGSIGTFTYMRCRDRSNQYEENPHLDIVKDAANFAENYKLFFRSIGDQELHLREFEEDDRFLAQYGIDKLDGYVRELIPGESHTWNCWRRALYDFVQLLFR